MGKRGAEIETLAGPDRRHAVCEVPRESLSISISERRSRISIKFAAESNLVGCPSQWPAKAGDISAPKRRQYNRAFKLNQNCMFNGSYCKFL